MITLKNFRQITKTWPDDTHMYADGSTIVLYTDSRSKKPHRYFDIEAVDNSLTEPVKAVICSAKKKPKRYKI